MDNLYFIELFHKFIARTATKDEIRILLEWIKKDSRYIDAWMDEEWEAAPNQIPSEVKERILNRIYLLMDKSGQTIQLSVRRKWMRWTKYAAVIFFPIFLFLMGYYYSDRMHFRSSGLQTTAILTNKGERVMVILPDSSVAWVNSESRLSYATDYNTKERTLHLEGEAYFDVRENPDIPFIVKTEYFSVKALGTEFGVCAYQSDKKASAVLVKGKVEIERDSRKTILLPDEKILFDKAENRLSKEECIDSRRFGEWKNGNIYLEGETLEEAVRRLKRVYHLNVVFESEEVKEKRFTGYLRSDNLVSVLEALMLASHVECEQRSDTVFFRAQ